MSSSAARRIAKDGLIDDDDEPLEPESLATLDEPTGEELERLRAQIDAGRAYFAAGGKGIPHEQVMARIRRKLYGA